MANLKTLNVFVDEVDNDANQISKQENDATFLSYYVLM